MLERPPQVTSTIIFLLISFTVSACSNVAKENDSQKLISSTVGITFHKSTPYFIDIEAPTTQLWVGCVGINKKRDTAYMTFYVLDGEKSWEFHYRRVLGVSQCLAEEKTYREMLEKTKTFRIVGIHTREEDGPDRKREQIPERFTSVKKVLTSIFIRLQAHDKCKAFFEHHCELPENYWADTTPP